MASQVLARHEMQLSAQTATFDDLTTEKNFLQTQLSSEKRKLVDAQLNIGDLQRKVGELSISRSLYFIFWKLMQY